MGINSITRITYTCDRCGTDSDSKDFYTHNSCGFFAVQYKGHIGGKMCDQSWGGQSYEGDILICNKCAKDFLSFVRNKEVKSRGTS